MAKLYEIDQAIMECIDLETGEVIDFERLEELQVEREKKIENIAKYYINCVSDAEQYEARKKHFYALEITAKKKAESMKAYLSEILGGEKFKTADVSISYRTSEAVNFEDETSFVKWAQENRDDFLKIEAPEIDKTALKAAIKAGQDIKGAYIEKRSNIQIK